jgi:hypothetical protein
MKIVNKFGVVINERHLSKISISDLIRFVFRYMGLGGRSNAVTMVLPFTNWFLSWKESKKLAP